MKIRHLLTAAILCCTTAFWSTTAQAVIDCRVVPKGFAVTYDPKVATPIDAESSVTINCTRASDDPGTVGYSLAAESPNTKGQGSQASLAGGSIPYDVYQDAGRTMRWGPKGNAVISEAIAFGAGVSASVAVPYYARIPAGTNVAAGRYSDSVTTTLTYGNRVAVSALGILVNVDPSCQLSTPMGSMSLPYPSGQTTAAVSTSFAVVGTSGVPYALSLDATSGTILGLGYTLSLSGSAGTGTGALQKFTVKGTMPGKLGSAIAAGICPVTNVHTLTVSY